MPIYTNEDIAEWSLDYRRRVHEWCWDKDYGNCDLCALNKGLYEHTEEATDADHRRTD